MSELSWCSTGKCGIGGGGSSGGSGGGGGAAGGSGCGCQCDEGTFMCLPGTAGELPSAPGGYYGPNSAFCACVAAGTLIELLDGSTKLAEEIRQGDVLIGYDENGERTATSVVEVFRGEQPCIEVMFNGGWIVCSASHKLILGDGSPMDAALLDCEIHRLLGSDGQPKEIRNLRLVDWRPVFGWNCEPFHTYSCAGIIHHNKFVPPGGPSGPPP